MEIPEFEIGQLVAFRVALAQDEHRPLAQMVLEKIVQTCHGGTQTFYVVRGHESNHKISAIELIAWDSRAVQDALEAYRERNRRPWRSLAEAASSKPEPPKE